MARVNCLVIAKVATILTLMFADDTSLLHANTDFVHDHNIINQIGYYMQYV